MYLVCSAHREVAEVVVAPGVAKMVEDFLE
jgi:hypothetical protein